MKKCIILANGDVPNKSVVEYFRNLGYSTLITADGGANTAYKMNIQPDFIIGDLDSINSQTLKYYSNNPEVKIIYYKRQNDTDVEKCLKHAIKLKCKKVVLLGATGNRLDHSFCNMGIVLKYFHKISIMLIHHNSILTAYTGKVKLKTIPNEIVSIYGFNKRTRIKSIGLKYPLKNVALPFGEKESTSNTAIGNSIELSITNGVIFVIRNFNLLKCNGLI